MKYERITTRVRLMSALASFLAVAALSIFGSGWPAPANTAHGQTIPTVTPGDDGDHGHHKTPTSTAFPTAAAEIPSPTRVEVPGEIPGEPGQGGEGDSAGRRCHILITPDDLAEPGTLLVTEAPVDALPNRDPRYSYLRACDVQFRDKNGQIQDSPSSAPYVFANPISVCFSYTDEDLVRAQNEIGRLTILYYDEASKQWIELPIVLDQAARQICAQLPQTGMVVLAIKGAQAASLPNTSGNMPEGVPASGGAPQAAPAPTAAPVPTANNPAAEQTADAPTVPAAEPAAIASNPLGANPAAPAAAAVSSSGLPALLIIGLLVALSIAAAIIALSRSFFVRSHEGEE